jgi:hypothetical protein
MPLNRLWKYETEHEQQLTEEEGREVEIELGEVADQLEPFQTQSWEALKEMLLTEQKHAFADMMSAEDEQQIVLARERARVITRILSKPEQLEQKRDQLREELRQLEEESS